MGLVNTVQNFFDHVSNRATNENNVVKFRHRQAQFNDKIVDITDLEMKEIECCISATD